MDTKSACLLIVALIVVMVGMWTGTALSDHNKTEQMKACVAAGMEWKREFGGYYECVDK